MGVDDEDQEGRNDQEHRPRQRDTCPDGNGDVQHDLVKELDQVARQASPDEQADGKVALFEVVGRAYEGIASVGDHRVERSPEDHTQRQMREEFVKVGPEERGIQRPHAADHDAHAQREPQRPEHGAAIAQHDVEPGQRPPDVGAAGAFPPVGQGASMEIGMNLAHACAVVFLSAMRTVRSRVRVPPPHDTAMSKSASWPRGIKRDFLEGYGRGGRNGARASPRILFRVSTER
ncbi:hypothetical protein D9M68_627100 [compost metagenome]